MKHKILKGDFVLFFVIHVERKHKVRTFGTIIKIHGDTAIIKDKRNGLHNRKLQDIHFVKKKVR